MVGKSWHFNRRNWHGRDLGDRAAGRSCRGLYRGRIRTSPGWRSRSGDRRLGAAWLRRRDHPSAEPCDIPGRGRRNLGRGRGLCRRDRGRRGPARDRGRASRLPDGPFDRGRLSGTGDAVGPGFCFSLALSRRGRAPFLAPLALFH